MYFTSEGYILPKELYLLVALYYDVFYWYLKSEFESISIAVSLPNH